MNRKIFFNASNFRKNILTVCGNNECPAKKKINSLQKSNKKYISRELILLLIQHAFKFDIFAIACLHLC